jgi:FkbM family methyltransferase
MQLESPKSVAAQLEELLAESRGDASRRAAETFDALAGDCADRTILFGAGGLGRRTLAGLRSLNKPPLAFADNNKAAWGSTIEGLPVLSPQEAAERYRDNSVFIVTIWRAGGTHRFQHTKAQLVSLGVQRIAHAGHLFWKHPDVFLPFYAMDLPQYVFENTGGVRKAFDLLADDESRKHFLEQVRWRLWLDFENLSSPGPAPQYLPPGLFAWSKDEVFIDVGAYDGDTVRQIATLFGGDFDRIVSLEPDPVNMAKLQATVQSLPPSLRQRVEMFPFAVGAEPGRLKIEPSGLPSSQVGSGSHEVECVTLDNLLTQRKLRPTFIKMDIEGAEPGALQGARNVIRDCRPILAVCGYHLQNHLWRIPLLIADIEPSYKFFMRTHNEEAWDLVCYAVPPERCLIQ